MRGNEAAGKDFKKTGPKRQMHLRPRLRMPRLIGSHDQKRCAQNGIYLGGGGSAGLSKIYLGFRLDRSYKLKNLAKFDWPGYTNRTADNR